MATALFGNGSGTSTGSNPNTLISDAIAQMSASGDPRARAMAAQLSTSYGAPAKGNLSLIDQVKHAAGVAANYAAPVLNVLNRPSQAVLHGVQDVAQGTGNPLADAGKALFGQNDDINLRQAVLGNDQGHNNLGLDKGGLAAGLIDTVGMAALDPTTLLGGPAAKLGLKGAAAGGRAVAATDAGAAALGKLAPIADKLQPIKNALSPGAKLESALGKDEGQAVKQQIQGSATDALQQTGDVNNQLNALIKQSGISDDELKNVVNPALESGGGETLARNYATNGDALKANLVTKLNEILAPASEHSGALEFPGGVQSAPRLPFEFGKAGLKSFNKDGEGVANALGVSLSDLEKAHTTGDISHLGGTSLNDLEQKLQQSGIIKEGEQGLNHDIVNLATKRAQKDAQAGSKRQLLTQTLHDATDNKGQKIVLGEGEKALADKRGFVGTTLADGSKVYVHPEVDKAMKDTAAVINQDKTVEAFHGAMKQAERLWKGYAVLSPHFHSQNAFGNMFMNAVAGMRNPKYYGEAMRLQKVMGGLSKSTEGFNAALAKLPEKDRAAITALRSQHIADSSFSHAILSNPRELKGAAEGVTGKARAGASALKPWDENNIALRGNKALGSAMENNARIAHFLWKFDETGDAKLARQSVAKHLFDYNDLTPFERRVMQKYVPFYTYMRKNTPAQLALLSEHPGFYANYGKLQQNLQQNGPDDGTQYDAAKLAQGAFPVQLPGMSSPVLMSPSSPFYSAFQQLQPLGDLAALIPGSPTANTVADPKGSAFQNVLSSAGGFSGGLAKFAADEATGKNVDTGGTIKPGNNLSLLAGTVLPTFNLVNGTRKAAQSGNDAKLFNNLAGVPVSQGGASATASTEQGRLADVQAALASLQGSIGKSKLPTVTQLRKEGRLPRATTAHKRRAKGAKRSHHKKV